MVVQKFWSALHFVVFHLQFILNDWYRISFHKRNSQPFISSLRSKAVDNKSYFGFQSQFTEIISSSNIISIKLVQFIVCLRYDLSMMTTQWFRINYLWNKADLYPSCLRMIPRHKSMTRQSSQVDTVKPCYLELDGTD